MPGSVSNKSTTNTVAEPWRPSRRQSPPRPPPPRQPPPRPSFSPGPSFDFQPVNMPPPAQGLMSYGQLPMMGNALGFPQMPPGLMNMGVQNDAAPMMAGFGQGQGWQLPPGLMALLQGMIGQQAQAQPASAPPPPAPSPAPAPAPLRARWDDDDDDDWRHRRRRRD